MTPHAAKPDENRGRQAVIAIAFSGGGARALAHIGVIEVLESVGLRPAFIAATSMGGLVAALWGRGVPVAEMITLARGFKFPRWYLPGRILAWRELFAGVEPLLEGLRLEQISLPVVLSTVDILAGEQVVLSSGPLLSAVRATCAVPGVLPPVQMDDRFLVDGGVLNPLPTDLAWACEPDGVINVNVRGSREDAAEMEAVSRRVVAGTGRRLPRIRTARAAFRLATRAIEMCLDRQVTLASAMDGPSVVIDVDTRAMSMTDFHLADEAIAAGRSAARDVLPAVQALFASRPAAATDAPAGGEALALATDPVCGMLVSRRRARAVTGEDGVTRYFCSPGCREACLRHPSRYAPRTRPATATRDRGAAGPSNGTPAVDGSASWR